MDRMRGASCQDLANTMWGLAKLHFRTREVRKRRF